MFVTARFVGRTVAGAGIGVEIFIIDDESRTAWVHYYHQQQAHQQQAHQQQAHQQQARTAIGEPAADQSRRVSL